MSTQDGIFPGTTRAEYDAIEAINYSCLKLMAKSPAHCREAQVRPHEPTPAMELGTAIHAAILQPHLFKEEFAVGPKCDRRYAAGKAAWAKFELENTGKNLLKWDEGAMVSEVAAAVGGHKTAGPILAAKGVDEVAVVWTHKGTGVRCKALLDRITVYDGWTVVPDLKSTADASPAGFAKSIANFNYHEQAAWYLDGLNHIKPLSRRFIWIALEKARPYGVATYEPDDEMLRIGRALAEEHVYKYAGCLANDCFPGYPEDIQQISLPKWAAREEE